MIRPQDTLDGAYCTYPIPKGATAFAYIYAREGFFGAIEKQAGKAIAAAQLVVFSDGKCAFY